MAERIEGLETNSLAGESAANGASAAEEFDGPFVENFAGEPANWVLFGAGEMGGAGTGAIEHRWAAAAERLMGAQGIVLLSPAVEAALLGAAVGCRRVGGVGFENAMHLFVAAIVLGFGGTNKFDADAQASPPNTQSGKT